jgi:hypothetical protein
MEQDRWEKALERVEAAEGAFSEAAAKGPAEARAPVAKAPAGVGLAAAKAAAKGLAAAGVAAQVGEAADKDLAAGRAKAGAAAEAASGWDRAAIASAQVAVRRLRTNRVCHARTWTARSAGPL